MTFAYIKLLLFDKELSVRIFIIMPRSNVDCDEVWREISREDFVNLTPSNEFDRVSVQWLTTLIREASDILQNPEIMRNLTQAQANDLRSKIRQLKTQLARESALARRVDPTVPLFNPREWHHRWKADKNNIENS